MSVRLRASKRVSAEDTLAMQLSVCGFAEGVVRQFEYAPPRRLKADFLVWRSRFIGRAHEVLVEVQGGIYSRQGHGSVTGVLADIDRLNAATVNGYRMLRFTPQMIDSGEAMTVIQKALFAYTPEERQRAVV